MRPIINCAKIEDNMIKGLWYKWIIVFLVSMVPLVELRGAIPIAEGFHLRPMWLYILIIIIGNMLPVPIIFFFARKVLLWGKNVFVSNAG